MKDIITISKADLQDLIKQTAVDAIMSTIANLRNGEIIISIKERERLSDMEKDSQVEKLLNGVEAADVLCCSSAQITKLRNNGAIQSTCIGSRWYYPYSGLIKYKKARTINK